MLSLSTYAQQVPLYNAYWLNPYLVNPAAAGASDYGKVSLIHRSQWANMADAPVTSAGLFDMPLRKTNMGIGAVLYHDQMHLLNRFGGSVTYAYHIPFSKEFLNRLSFGLSLGVFNQRFDGSRINIEQDADASIFNTNLNAFAFDFAAGAMYRYKGFRFGISLPQLLSSTLEYVNNDGQNAKFKNVRQYNFAVDQKIEITNGFTLRPGVMLRTFTNLPLQVDGYLGINILDFMNIGFGYRSNNRGGAGFNGSMGILIKNFGINYTYENVVNSLDRNALGASHEVMLTYRFGNELEKTLKELKDNDDRLDKAIAAETFKRDSVDKVLADADKKIDTKIGTVKDFLDTFQTKRDTIYALSKLEYKKLGSVLFDKNDYKLTDAGKANLDYLYQDLSSRNCKILNLYLEGNASREGGNDANFTLSMRRVEAVRNYLVMLGLDKDKLILLPYGEDNPITKEQTSEQQRSMNRRVDIFITSENK